MKNYATKRKYEVEFHFDKPDPSYRNKNVVKWKVKFYSMAAAIKDVERKMWEKGLIRQNMQPRSATVHRISWPSRGKKADASKL